MTNKQNRIRTVAMIASLPTDELVMLVRIAQRTLKLRRKTEEAGNPSVIQPGPAENRKARRSKEARNGK